MLIVDDRTLRHLFQKAGFDASPPAPAAQSFLRLQRFVDPGHPALAVLHELLSRGERQKPSL